MTSHKNDVDAVERGSSDEATRIDVCRRLEDQLDAVGIPVIRQEALGQIRLPIQVDDEALTPTFLTRTGEQPVDVCPADSSLEVEHGADGRALPREQCQRIGHMSNRPRSTTTSTLGLAR